MSDRVQAFREGLQDKLKETCRKTIGIDCPYSYDCEHHGDCMYEESLNYVSFLVSQGLGWAEELLEFPDMVFHCKDCDKIVTNTRCNITGAGAVKFVPLEVKDETYTNESR